METWIFLYFHLDCLGTERNGNQSLTWIDVSFRSVPINLYLVFNTPLEHCNIFPRHLFLPRSPLRSVRKWLVQHLNISLFQRSGAEWLWQWWEHHLNFAISSLAIYSYTVPRSAPWENDWYSTWTFPCSNRAERNGFDNDGNTTWTLQSLP
jgi:hypothetical protein